MEIRNNYDLDLIQNYAEAILDLVAEARDADSRWAHDVPTKEVVSCAV